MMESYKGGCWLFLDPVRKIYMGNIVRRGKIYPEDNVKASSTDFSLETLIIIVFKAKNQNFILRWNSQSFEAYF